MDRRRMICRARQSDQED